MTRENFGNPLLSQQVTDFGPRNLEEVRGAVLRSQSQDAKDMLWALDCVAKVNQSSNEEPVPLTLARIPANVPLLRSYIKKPGAARGFYADSTWKNVRIHLFSALRLTGVRVRQGRRRVRLSEPWQHLMDRLPEDQLMILYPFARWCDERGCIPDTATESTFEDYEAYIEGFDGRENRRNCFLAVCRAWNKAAAKIPGWPTFVFSVKKRYDRYLRPFNDFAPSFEQDVDAALTAAMHPDPTEPRRRKRLNARTAKHQRYQLRRIASALCAQSRRDPKSITSIADLVDPIAAREALRFLIARAHKRQADRAR